MGIRLFSTLMIVCVVVLIALPGFAAADEQLAQAVASLEQKKYKQAVQFAGKTLATAKQKPDVMAKALLTRGVAYRAQGKYAQAIADFSNAEWLRKLPKEDLRALYAERALAYEAVGQAKLAAKDRKTASSNLLKGASTRKSIVKTTGLKPKNAPVQTQQQSTDFFGGLGNLFGFNNNSNNNKKVQTAAKVQTPPVENKTPLTTSGGELASKMGGDATKKVVAAKKTKEIQTEVKTNSAWAAQRIAEDKKLEAARIIEAAKNREAEKKIKAGQIKVAQNKIPPKPVIKASEVKAPVKLTPVEPKSKGGGNVVTNFFDSIFGGGQQKAPPPPVPPVKEQDVIVADQVAAQKTPVVKKAVKPKKVVAKKRPVKVVKKPVKVALAKPVEKKVVTKRETAARSLYHLQLGAFGEASAADQFVDRLNKNHKKIVGSKVAMVVETDLGNNRRQYKVYLGPYRDRQKSISSCRAFKQVGLGCSLLE